MLSVDDRKDRPFHCDVCGDTFEPCRHWEHPLACTCSICEGLYRKPQDEL